MEGKGHRRLYILNIWRRRLTIYKKEGVENKYV